MTLIQRLKGIAIAIVILIAIAPIAVLISFLSVPMLDWIETHFAVEAIGHSGPAESVFIVVYGVLVVAATTIWSWRIRKHRQRG